MASFEKLQESLTQLISFSIGLTFLLVEVDKPTCLSKQMSYCSAIVSLIAKTARKSVSNVRSKLCGFLVLNGKNN